MVERIRTIHADFDASLAAVALAKAGLSNGFAKPLAQLLDSLPISTLTAVATHVSTL